MQRDAGPLPRALPFLGRSAELDALEARFEEGTQLVTLLGPGGIGKTSLAVEHAMRRVASGARTSVVFCDVSDARDAAGIVDAMAIACGAALGASGEGVARVGAALAARGEVVVVVDNLDGLTGHAPETIVQWAALAPEAEIVVTSRERLDVVGEVVVEVSGLEAVAGVGADEGEAVALLVAAARRGSSGFMLRAEDAAFAAEIVRLLEGAPLAIEMAGSRLPLVGARALLERLRESTESLRREAKGGPDRHGSLDAAVAGSFDTLEAYERDALAQLTVFRGGFTVISAEAVVEIAGASTSVIEVVDGLRARSLVRTRDAAAARFDLYASVRSYVQRVHPAPIAGAAERHAAFFVTSAERNAANSYRDAPARAWLAVERENVLAVAARVLAAGPVTARSAEPALRGIVALSPLLLARGPLASVAALIAPVVERTRDSGADPRLTARATLLRGAIAREAGDVRSALKDLLGAEGIARALGDELLVADIRVELGRTMLAGGETAAGRDHFDKAVRAFGALGARSREAHALAWLAISTATDGVRRDVATARTLLQRSVALAAGDPASRAPYLLLLGRACAESSDGAGAKRALEDAIATAALDGDSRTEAAARMLLGMVLHDGGDLARAAEILASARDTFDVHGLHVDAAVARGHLGVVAREEGRVAEAYALLADARDVMVRCSRGDEADYFGRHLGALGGMDADMDVGPASSASPMSSPAPPSSGAGLMIIPTPPPSSVRDLSAGGPVRPRAGGRELVAAWRIEMRTDGTTPSLHLRLATRAAKGPQGRVGGGGALPEDALVVGVDGGWFRAPGAARVGLERRRSLALLLDRLTGERLAHAGATLGSAALFAAAWPGEKAITSAASHRVRVAIATLRKMGLKDAIVTQSDGYALSSELRVVRA